MKKTVIAISIALVSAIGFSAFAQSQQTVEPKKEKKEKRGDRKNMQFSNPFEGITLSAEQQSKLENLRNDSMRNDSIARNEAKKKHDEMKKANEQKRNEMKQARQQKKRDYLNNVKAILTPEQYVVFLENTIINQPAGKCNVRQRPDNRQKNDNKRNNNNQRPGKDMKKHNHRR